MLEEAATVLKGVFYSQSKKAKKPIPHNTVVTLLQFVTGIYS